jgi:hypothetical protein
VKGPSPERVATTRLRRFRSSIPRNEECYRPIFAGYQTGVKSRPMPESTDPKGFTVPVSQHFPSLDACARPRAGRLRKSKTLAG